MRNFWIVFTNSFKESVKSKIFICMTLGLMVCAMLIVLGPKFFENKNEKLNHYVLVNQTNVSISKSILEKNLPAKWEIIKSGKISKLKAQTRNKAIDGFIIIKDTPKYFTIEQSTLRKNDILLPLMESVFSETYKQQLLLKSKMTNSELEKINKKIIIDNKPIYNANETGTLLILGLVSLMTMAITVYGNSVATQIASEKQSRVMELMVTKVKPIPMMFGKIFGIGMACLIQILIFFMTLIIMLKVIPIEKEGYMAMINKAINIETVVLLLALFTLGYFIYTTLFAIIGVTVARAEDISSASLPILGVLIGSLLLEMFIVMEEPEHLISRLSSYVPFTAPMSVMIRMIYGTISHLEILMSTIVMLFFLAIFAMIAAYIYPKGVMKEDKLTMKQWFLSS